MQTSAFGANGMKVVNEVIETLKTRKGPNGSRLSDAAIMAEAARLVPIPLQRKVNDSELLPLV